MPEYYTPRNKAELVRWIKQRYWVTGQTCQGLDKMPKKRLYAIFYSLLDRVKQRELEVFNAH